jgi:anti-sigma B factor antagonist
MSTSMRMTTTRTCSAGLPHALRPTSQESTARSRRVPLAGSSFLTGRRRLSGRRGGRCPAGKWACVTATSRRQVDPSSAHRMSVETVHFDGQHALMRVTGDLDMSTAPPLRAMLHSHLEAGRRFLRLDLSAVAFLDASALGGITTAHHEALGRRGTLVITGVHSLVARLLRLTGLDEVLLVGGPRADDDLPVPSPVSDDRPDPAWEWPDWPVPSLPRATARSIRRARSDRPPVSRPAIG